jgi:hypothetical protein
MILHPLADEFLSALGNDDLRRKVFLRLCEACADRQGRPTIAGLRRLDEGHFDERIGDEWKPLFIDVYRRWLGFRMEREFLEPARPLSVAWWFTAPPVVRMRVHGWASRLFSPAAGTMLVVVLLAGLGFKPLLGQHERRQALEAAMERHALARQRLAAEEDRVTALLLDGSHESLREALSLRPTLESLGEHAARERVLLAERAGVQLRQ